MIPVLNWNEFQTDPQAFVTRLGKACRETGFFLLSDHGVPQNLIEGTFAAGDALFSLPKAEKAAFSIYNNPHNRGWTGEGSENLDDSSDQVDRKEAFNVGLDLAADDPRVLAGEPFRGVNVWPDLPGFRETVLDYYDRALALGVDLHRAIALDLGLEEHYFTPHFSAPLSTLRMLTYPPGTGAAGEIGAGAHTDYGSITLLMTDGEGGLQVQPRGQDWADVPHVPGAFVVNIADCLMRWTNDIYVSTPHRVLPPKRQRRSLAFFMDPNPDSVIRALPGTGEAKYPPVTGADYLRHRLDATYAPEPAE
ncbi:isopenicillin N synthase family dioxygenase [Chachezhania antarctica]|uniref:isopenicillin N synthase family dioxygenase n=1 Tax=Chachezhania antarctica TaxID=2340860 RepID=UPI000EAD2E41|nr:2-oxoglutarate and iron-dependent oxygenase domain-containing protein [Chachezhania antarctica]